MVVSTAPKPSDWHTLEHATGLDLGPKSSPYWASREAFDAGKLSPEEYWAAVLDRSVTSADVEWLEAHDSAQWSHLNSRTLAILETLQGEGANVALLSNMPIRMAQQHLAESSWTDYFSRLYFSGMLGLAKPDPQIFDHVLADLEARPQDVVFIDDNATNVAAARVLGFRTILHTSATNLRQELPTVSG